MPNPKTSTKPKSTVKSKSKDIKNVKAEMLKKKQEMLKKKAKMKTKNMGLDKKKGVPPTLKKGAVKPAAKAKNTKVYKKIKSTSTYNPKLLKESDEKLEMDSPAKMSGRSYDMKMAYDKKLTPEARLHYLENERHDADSPNKMNSPYKKHGSPYHMGHKDSPMNKALVGKQHNLPEHLKKKIEAAPEMKGSPYHMSNELKYGGPVIDQMKSLSQAGSFKVLKHMKSKI